MASLDDMLSPSPKGDPDDGDSSDDVGADAEDAVRDFFTAGTAGDFKKAALALRDAVDLCGAMPDDEEPESGEEGGSHHLGLLLMPKGSAK